ncbi:hypothetical protein FNW02_36470, partial [Komarekiella sp. 'clone 1']
MKPLKTRYSLPWHLLRQHHWLNTPRKDSGGRVLTKVTLEREYHKYEPKPVSRIRPRKLEPVIKRATG